MKSRSASYICAIDIYREENENNYESYIPKSK